ncbi:hypothetical protein WH221_09835 [Chryseobacterium culicis]|uniref:C1q domain-containing protein n=1 Tax=Chryseobacterium culicis TaxID=680127 RepID=A0A2S9D180_CHRCI|nr:hypothetical protein [Chryseobacterium culicis]PRB86522.1 hypothetical protein CQ022_09810 [Chryseobacterium culicis]PRB92275.1 hypothetical protein CQ033_03480 [Chryseobacterium culicis]
MKKIIFALFVVSGTLASAQVLSNGAIANQFPNENVFLDASTNNNATVNDGKGLLFPSTDLTQFTFKTGSLDGINFPSAYDGMVVYNTTTGNTVTGNGVVTAVVPGFYYFSNPGQSTSVATGRWVSIGGSPKVTVGTAETTTNTIINVSPGVDKQLFAIKGTFTASGTSTAVNIPAPTGMTTMYGITIYKAGTNTVYDRSLYSYNPVATPGNAITGSPSMSVVYPSGTYDYVLEYLK